MDQCSISKLKRFQQVFSGHYVKETLRIFLNYSASHYREVFSDKDKLKFIISTLQITYMHFKKTGCEGWLFETQQ